MTRLGRGQRIAVVIWVIVAVVAWNGLYDLLLARSTQNYLFRTAMHDAGRGPAVDLTAALDYAVYEAVWLSTLWAGILLLAGLVTIRLCTTRTNRPGERTKGAVDADKINQCIP